VSRTVGWATMSRTERDAAYNNGKAVADNATLNAARIDASKAFRAAHPAHLDLAYGPCERNRWDLFPGPDAAAPCLVFIHGGYWQMNRREDFAVLGEGLASHGWSIALPGYTLAPEATLTEIVSEIEHALDWLAENGARHGIAGPIILSGWSAGGHLAAMGLSHPAVKAGLAISGVYDLELIRDTYLNDKLKLTDKEIAMLSPLRLPAVPKPLSIAYGTAELSTLVADSRDLHALRAAAHQPGTLLPVAGANHFTILNELRAPTGQVTRLALELAR
jgi:arylformamidase